jgi:hypothetical protein
MPNPLHVETRREGPRNGTNGHLSYAGKEHLADKFDEEMVKIAQVVQKIWHGKEMM